MSSVKSVFTCWTKFKGGKFKLNEKNNTWKEYNDKNEIVNTYKQLDRLSINVIFISI